MADKVISGFVDKLPLGELTQKVADFEVSINEKKGDILSLRNDLKDNLIGKIDTVATKAAEKNIEFNVDPDLKAASKVKEVVTSIGKRIFPKTETLQEVQITSQRTTSNTSGG
jgi:hypothetical protein